MATTEMNCLASGGGNEVIPLTDSSDSSYYYVEASWSTNAKCVILICIVGASKNIMILDLVNGTSLWTAGQTVTWQSAGVAACSFHYESRSAKGFKLGSVSTQYIGNGIAIPLEEYPDGYFS